MRRKGRARKIEVAEFLGGKCVCCGEDRWEFLTVDHVDGGGTQERKRIGVVAIYKRILSGEPGYRLLCMNCNTSIGYYGYCPHRPDDLRQHANRISMKNGTSGDDLL
jgi:hypothetical protein